MLRGDRSATDSEFKGWGKVAHTQMANCWLPACLQSRRRGVRPGHLHFGVQNFPQQTLGFQALNYSVLKPTKPGVWSLLCWSQYHSTDGETEANRGQVHLMPSPQGSSVDISSPVIGHAGFLTSICSHIPQGLGMCSLLEQPGPRNHSCHTTDNHQGALAMHSRSTVAYTNRHLMLDLMSPRETKVLGFV